MFKLKFALIIVLISIIHINITQCQIEAIRDFIQINVGGLPLIHKKTNWPFDPDISLKRRKIWEDTNGIKGAKVIERLGLGRDGLEYERLEKQRQRDEGHLGGLNYFTP